MDPATRCSIIPPYVLERLAQSDLPLVAEPARDALAHDQQLRQERRSGRRFQPPSEVNEPGPVVLSVGNSSASLKTTEIAIS